MHRTLRHTFTALSGIALLFLANAAQADTVSLIYDLPVITAQAGDTVTFRGALQNLTGASITLIGDSFSQVDPIFTGIDDNAFFNTTPLTLTAGQKTVSQALFSITIDPGAANGTYTGDFIVQDDNGNDVNLSTATFTVNVAPGIPVTAPEPGSLLLLMPGFAGVVFYARRRNA